jgi:hypothetical protein
MNLNQFPKNSLINYFSFLKGQPDYSLSAEKLKELCRNYFQLVPDYELFEETFIDCIIPAIHYLNDEYLERRISSKLLDCRREFFDGERYLLRVNDDLDPDSFSLLVKDIQIIRNDYKFLNQFKTPYPQMTNRNNYIREVYRFLESSGIWKLEGQDGWHEWQYEWDIEYFEILLITPYCHCIEELNDVYRMVWLYYVSDYYPNEILPEVKIIWDNIESWKVIHKELVF